MLSIINFSIILISLLFSIKSYVTYSLVIPILLYYFKKKKHIYVIIPLLLLSFLILEFRAYIILLIIAIILYCYNIILKKSNILIESIIILILSFISTLLLNEGCKYLDLIFVLVGLLTYLFIMLSQTFHSHTIKLNTFNSFIWIDILICLIASFSIVGLDFKGIDVFLIVSCLFAIVLSKKHNSPITTIYGLFATILGAVYYKTNDYFIIILISCSYVINSIYSIGIINAVLALFILINKMDYPYNYLIIMLTSIVIEIASCFSKRKPIIVDSYSSIHEMAQKNVNDEILKLTSVFDKFIDCFKESKDYNEMVSSSVKTILDKHCFKCENKKDCFSNNKNTLYQTFKKLITNDNIDHSESKLKNYCLSYSNVFETSKLLNKQLVMNDKNQNNYTLISQLSGVNNALRNYVIDKTSKVELNYINLLKCQELLKNTGVNIIDYEILRSYNDDFLIIFITKNKIKSFEQLNKVLSNYLECDVSIELKKQELNNYKYSISPKPLIDILYAYGSIPKDNEIVCGDNYLIKESDNSHIILAISDGMGSGYNAYLDSNQILNLVESIIDLHIDTSTSIAMLNSFYVVLEYLDRFATLDMVDIDRHSCVASFFKMGANTTYIYKSNNKIEKILNTSLPFGIDEEIKQYDYKLEDGDLIIMSSDGIIENLLENEEFDKMLYEVKDLTCEQIVYEILNFTIQKELKTKDDMTLIVSKVQEK